MQISYHVTFLKFDDVSCNIGPSQVETNRCIKNQYTRNEQQGTLDRQPFVAFWYCSFIKIAWYVEGILELKNASHTNFVRWMEISTTSRSSFLMGQGQWNRCVCIASATTIVVRKEIGRSVVCNEWPVSGFVQWMTSFRWRLCIAQDSLSGSLEHPFLPANDS